MKIASSSSLRRNRVCPGDFCDVDGVIRKRKAAAAAAEGVCRRRPRRRVAAGSSAIQTLFLACKSIFGGPPAVPSPADVRMIRSLLDMMTSEDVDLSPDIPFFRAKTTFEGVPGVSYTTIYQSSSFSICIFFLRPGAVIPLHDHPGMTVFSKLLLGSMHVRAYDFVDQPHLTSDSNAQDGRGRRRRLAKLTVDTDLTAPCKTAVLFPETGGNIHTFMAITPCAVLDIMGPPYSAQEGRDITYYKDLPLSDEEVGVENGEGEYSWLEETDMPEEAVLVPVTYLGPPVVDV